MDILQIDSFVNALGVEIKVGNLDALASRFSASTAPLLVAAINSSWAAGSVARGDTVPTLKAGDTVAHARGALVILITRYGEGSSVTVTPISDGSVPVTTAELCSVGEPADVDVTSVESMVRSIDLTSFLVGAVVGAIVT